MNLTIKELVEKASFDGTQDVFVYYTFRHLPNAFGDMKSLLYKLPGADDIGSMTHSPEIGENHSSYAVASTLTVLTVCFCLCNHVSAKLYQECVTFHHTTYPVS